MLFAATCPICSFNEPVTPYEANNCDNFTGSFITSATNGFDATHAGAAPAGPPIQSTSPGNNPPEPPPDFGAAPTWPTDPETADDGAITFPNVTPAEPADD